MASPELEAVIRMLRSRPVPETPPTWTDRRKGFEMLATALFRVADDVRVTPTLAGGVPAEWVEAPEAAPDRALLYLHGGGYTTGSPATHRDLAGRLSRAAGVRVLNVDYRLPREHPQRAAVEDAPAAFRWLLGEGIDPARAAVAGDSAGGGLTLATLVALRDEGTPLPAAGVGLSPWVDLAGLGESMTSKAAADPMVQREGLLEMARAYLGAHPPRTPLAAPLHADLRGLPPLLLHVGTAETLLDDALRFAERAREAGVDVRLEAWDDMVHVWHIFAPMLPEGQQAIERIGEFLRKRLV